MVVPLILRRASRQNLASTLASPMGKLELKQLFDALDVDGDGRVSRKEWGAAVARDRTLAMKYFGGATARELDIAFSRIDVDGRHRAVTCRYMPLHAGSAWMAGTEPVAYGVSWEPQSSQS